MNSDIRLKVTEYSEEMMLRYPELRQKMNNEKRKERLRIAREKGTHTKAQWEEMKEFFNCCLRCGTTERIEKDHIKPIYQGGSDGIDNIQPLCQSCNCSKGPDNVDLRIEFFQAYNYELREDWFPNIEAE